MISKRHCALLLRGDKVFIRDFDSTNGTMVNDVPVKGESELKDDDRLLVGPLSFLVRLESGPAAKPGPVETIKPPVSDNVDDESAAALLLDVAGAEETSNGREVDSEGIPTGSTVMDLPAIEGSESKPGGDKTPPPKQPVPDTSNAAKAILDKYTRRRRT
jgi:pSer/pThr/pTyr-binding forkhead associated (FHA) protein